MSKKPRVIQGGLTYQTGCRPGERLPVMLRLAHSSGFDLPTYWDTESAEAMAYGLLKAVEITRREEAKLRASGELV